MIKRYDITMDEMVEVTQEDWDKLEKEQRSFGRAMHDIRKFHEKFGLAYQGPPRELPEDLQGFRMVFMAEELCEYATDNPTFHQLIQSAFKDRSSDQPLEKQLDALVDLVYVALGTAYLHGFNFSEAWNRVHEANMAKVRVERIADSKRGSVYDVVKPEGWKAPDLSDLVDTHNKS